MKIFDTAYLKLTAWYVAIIMAISLLFSVWVYSQARHEIQFGLTRIVHYGPQEELQGMIGRQFVEEQLAASRRRLILRLAGFNLTILAAGAAGSYFLARRTMRPIEDAVETQHRFTADASHELRTPLAAMKTEIEVGLRDKKLTKDEAIALLQSNLEEVDRLGGLAEGLLTLSQADKAVMLAPVSLEEVAAKVAKRLKSLADVKKIAIVKDLRPVIVQGDEAALDKIIGILLDNAIKYSPANTEITLRVYQKDSHAYVEVRDQGIGIKASELPHVFDRFYRADTSRSKTQIPGHGLGLSIAQKLSEQMNAKLTATSAQGKGSVFLLSLSQN